MPGQIRYHLDENVANAIADGLRRRSIDVTTTPEVGLIGTPDEVQLAFALSEERVIFTHDSDFLRLNQAGIEHAGIVYCRKNTRSIGKIVRRLFLFWEYVEPEDMRDRVEYL